MHILCRYDLDFWIHLVSCCRRRLIEAMPRAALPLFPTFGISILPCLQPGDAATGYRHFDGTKSIAAILSLQGDYYYEYGLSSGSGDIRWQPPPQGRLQCFAAVSIPCLLQKIMFAIELQVLPASCWDMSSDVSPINRLGVRRDN